MKNLKNKVVALLLIFVGVFSVTYTRDATILAITVLIGLPLFFAKNNYIY